MKLHHQSQQQVKWARLGNAFRIRLNFDDGQEGNQFSEINGQLSFLGLWGWRRFADFSIGTLRLESVLAIFSLELAP